VVRKFGRIENVRVTEGYQNEVRDIRYR